MSEGREGRSLVMLTGRNGTALVWQAVFCLALMGTNYVAFIREASRHRHEATALRHRSLLLPRVPQKTADFGHQESLESSP